MRLTKGFRTPRRLGSHFRDHGSDFSPSSSSGYSASQYEADADRFLGEAICQGTHPDSVSCVRLSNNSVIRYNLRTREFGVLSYDGYIQTYFIPDTVIHGFVTHYEYFFDEAQKI